MIYSPKMNALQPFVIRFQDNGAIFEFIIYFHHPSALLLTYSNLSFEEIWKFTIFLIQDEASSVSTGNLHLNRWPRSNLWPYLPTLGPNYPPDLAPTVPSATTPPKVQNSGSSCDPNLWSKLCPGLGCAPQCEMLHCITAFTY